MKVSFAFVKMLGVRHDPYVIRQGVGRSANCDLDSMDGFHALSNDREAIRYSSIQNA